MSKQTEANFFIVPPVVLATGFYQQVIKGLATYEQLGNWLLKEIKAAHAFRQVERVQELSSILVNFPVREYQLIAQYYLVWCEGRKSKLHSDLLDTIIDQTKTYKTKALISKAGFEGLKGNIENELYYYTEALNSHPDVSDYINASRAIAVVKSKEGFHNSALKDMERLLLVARHAEPIMYYDFLNSYAVELGEVGRKDEARNVIKHALASPYAFAYPEWRETDRDIYIRGYKSRFVSLQRNPQNLLHMPEVSERESRPVPGRKAPVINLSEWKEKMVEPNGDDKKLPDNMSSGDMVMELLKIVSQDDVTDEQRRKILDYAIKVLSKK